MIELKLLRIYSWNIIESETEVTSPILVVWGLFRSKSRSLFVHTFLNKNMFINPIGILELVKIKLEYRDYENAIFLILFF